jgi:protein gp37
MEYQARVFTCSISDFFIDHPAANSRRLGAWFVIRNTPNLTYLILTKRPHNILKMLPKDWGHGYPNDQRRLQPHYVASRCAAKSSSAP